MEDCWPAGSIATTTAKLPHHRGKINFFGCATLGETKVSVEHSLLRRKESCYTLISILDIEFRQQASERTLQLLNSQAAVLVTSADHIS